MLKSMLYPSVLVALLSSCAGQLSNASHVSTSTQYPATQASEIAILFEAPEQAYTVIGMVESHGAAIFEDKRKERSMSALKNEAATMGANAVIITSSKTVAVSGFDGDPAGEENVLAGKAIRYK